MKTFATLALGAGMTIALAGAAFAQSKASNDNLMSDTDKAMMTKCKGMSESAMKANKDCMAMMKAHPDMMKGTTGMNASPGSQSKTMPSNSK